MSELREQLGVLFEIASLGIVVLDQAGQIELANPALEAIFGYEPGELCGQPLEVLLTEDLRAIHAAHRAGFMAAPHTRPMGIKLDMLGRRKDGQAFPIEASLSYLQLHGHIIPIAFVIDVTKRKRTEEERDQLLVQEREARAAAEAAVRSKDEALALLDTLVQSAPIGFAFLDHELRYQLINTHLAEINQVPHESHIGHTMREVLPDFAPDIEPLFRRVLDNDAPILDLEVSSPTPAAPDQIRHRLCSYYPVRTRSGETLGVGAIVSDITERRRADQALRRQTTFTHLLQTVAVAANQATTLEEALQTAIDQICAHIGWPVGHVYLVGDAKPIALATTIWHLADPERFAVFRTITEAVGFPGVDDLPGRVLNSGRPEWISDMTAVPHLPRAGLISNIGVRAGFAFPILIGTEVVAVMEFFSPEAIEPDEALLEVMGHVGTQLGRVVERARAEEALHRAEARYRTLIEQVPAVIYTAEFGDTAAWHYVSPQIESLLGFTPDEWLAEPERWISQMYPDDRGWVMAAEERSQASGAPFYAEYRLIARGGRVIWVRDEAKTVPDDTGRPLYLQGVILDITERKCAEEALVEERALLARRVEERTADLSAANAELARAARLKDEFLASMSHELRTPLNAVLGLSEALQEEIYGPLNDRQRYSLQSIEESGRHLLELINDILDLAKIGAGKMELDLMPAAIGSICQASLRLIKPAAQKKRLTVEMAIDPAVTMLTVDARRLKQVLVNLLSNAVKFTPEGGTIGLDMRGDVARQAIELTIWDTGIGIAHDQMERLFQPFVQLDSRLARQYEGTGLGLALVYRMVEMHGGSIAVASEVGVGSRFTVALPWCHADVQHDTAQPAHGPAALAIATIRRAMIIEDSPTAADQIARYLLELGAATIIRPHGTDAVEQVVEFQPDLIMLDILLPDVSGWDVLAQLKADPRTQAIPIMVVSVVDERLRALELGAAGCLLKPITRDDILHMLGALASGAGQAAARALPRTPPIVLLAEDNEANVAMISDYLGTRGYQVVVARNGAEAIARAREVQPAIVVMDIQMPGMDGLEATRRIRADRDLAALPIIALTALSMPGDRKRCLEAGANDYLSKPVGLKGLAATIEGYLQKPSARH